MIKWEGKGGKGMARYANYIFDLYGTLADIRTDEESPAFWRRAAAYFGMHGAPYSAAELKKAYIELCAAEQAKSPDPLFELDLTLVFAALYRNKGVRPAKRLVEETAVAFRLLSTKKLRLYPWAAPVLDEIRAEGSRLFLLSNAQACFTRPELKLLGLEGRFDGIALSSEAGVRKPSPRIMRSLLDAYGLDPSDCIMTGNDQRADIALALRFGMDALYIETETSGGYDPAFAVPREIRGGDCSRIPELLGLERKI